MIRLIVLDVDGTLTDGGLYYSNDGVETKKFYVKDGIGILLAQGVGKKCMILTGKHSELVKKRASDLHIEYIFQGVQDKRQCLIDFMEKEELGDQALKSETYNINMLICRQSLITVGSSIRISVGFPPGYGPDDEGVTFKAYHFARDKNGEIIGMEEIPCTITRYGLVILCKSFSPFAIVAAKDDGTAAKAPKSIILSDTLGGSISGGEDGMLTLAPGESKELAIQAEDGYVIDSVVVGGKYQKVTNSKTMAVKADEKSLMNGDVIEAQFVAESVKQKEEARGETVVQPAPELEVKLKKNAISIKEKEGLTIESEVKVSQGELTYQWKKDGVALPGKTSDKLTIPSASVKDAGKYTLAVSAVSGIASVDKESGVCNVTVAAGQAPSLPL